MPDKTPVYFPENCPHCGTKVWHRLSRVDPTTWTEADFFLEYMVDPVAKTIERRSQADIDAQQALLNARPGAQ